MESIGPYTIKSVIGEGGTSTVYLANSLDGERLVAVKLLSEELSSDLKARERFKREAEMLSELKHPNIVPLIDFGSDNGRLYVVMPYLPNGSLRAKLGEGALPFKEMLQIIMRIAPALDAAHAEMIVHRDVKPQNILIGDDGEAYLSDFGVARSFDPDLPQRTLTLIGTPEFMAPEQCTNGQISPQTDIYQLGITVYQILTGVRPFNGPPLQVISRHLTESIPSAEAKNRLLPPGTDRVLEQALAKDPVNRFESAGQFFEALVALAEDKPTTQWVNSRAVAMQHAQREHVAESVAATLPLTVVVDNPAAPVRPSRRKKVRRTITAAVLSASLIGGSIFLIGAFDPNGEDNGNGNGGRDRGNNNDGRRNGELISPDEVIELVELDAEESAAELDETAAATAAENLTFASLSSSETNIRPSLIPAIYLMPDIDRAAELIGDLFNPNDSSEASALSLEPIEAEALEEQPEEATENAPQPPPAGPALSDEVISEIVVEETLAEIDNVGIDDRPNGSDEEDENRPPPPDRPRRGEGRGDGNRDGRNDNRDGRRGE